MASIKSKGLRKSIRDKLRVSHGDRCIWCGGIMEFPCDNPEGRINNLEEMATIEHYRAKLKNLGNKLTHLDLAHKRCNK